MAGEVSGGFICLWRKMLDSPIFNHDGLFRLWSFCLMRANWKDGKWFIPNSLIEVQIPRGSFITGRESLHGELYPERDKYGKRIKREYTPCSRTVWRWLEALERMNCINLQVVSNRCTIVSVCNYNLYQDINTAMCPTGVPPVSQSCPTGVPPVSTNEQGEPLNQENQGNKKDAATQHVAAGLQELIARWNAIPGVTPCRIATESRKTAYRQRSKEKFWVENLDEALRRVGESNFCKGGGERGWVADLDWFLKPKTVPSIIEGKYDNRNGKPSTSDLYAGQREFLARGENYDQT